jgi:rod shape-determining protein MreB
VRLICEAIRGILEEAPPEIAADLYDSGVTMVGGGSLLLGLPDAVSDHLGLPARVGSEPLSAVARGTGIFLDKLDVFSKVLATEEVD